MYFSKSFIYICVYIYKQFNKTESNCSNSMHSNWELRKSSDNEEFTGLSQVLPEAWNGVVILILGWLFSLVCYFNMSTCYTTNYMPQAVSCKSFFSIRIFIISAYFQNTYLSLSTEFYTFIAIQGIRLKLAMCQFIANFKKSTCFSTE